MQRTIILLLSSFIIHPSSFVHAASTINPTNRFAYGANIGWMDWRGDGGTNGVVIGEFYCSGYIYAANIGWINLGSGNPTNGVRYTNTGPNDFGVNHLGTGELSGYAYGANIGWIVFTNRTAAGPLLASEIPRFNPLTGAFSGYAYGANVGWIVLSNQFGYVKTDTLQPGADMDSDGIADAWEREYAGNLTTMSANTDSDGDGLLDVAEYIADTNPFSANDRLRITAFSATPDGSVANVTWTSRPTRQYRIQKRDSLTAAVWLDSGLGPIAPDPGATTTRAVNDIATDQRFFRVAVKLPLAP